jgi:lysophospholipase L1-like esterase
MKRHLRNLVFIGYVAIFCLVGGEIVTRAFYSRFSNYNMEMWRYCSEIKRPLAGQKLPFHHFPNKTGSYYGVEIGTNSLGFRDHEYSLKKPEATERILFLGDSFTLGWGVALDDLVSKVLERLLNRADSRYEVINMGIGNYNTTMEVELFKWKGLELGPDMVILMYFINDTEPVPGRQAPLAYTLLSRSYFCSFVFDRLTRLRSRFLRTFEWSTHYRRLYSPENADNLDSNTESIRELIRLCDENDIRLLIVNIPEMHEFKKYQFTYATDYVRDLAQEGGVEFLDMLPAFSGHEPESLWISLEDPHANAKAHAIMAQQIYDMIIEEEDRL